MPAPPTPPTPPTPETSYIYPFANEPRQFAAEVTFTLESAAAGVTAEIPPLKYNKTLLVMLTQDDCKQASYCVTWAAIHGKPLSESYYYDAPHLLGGDLPPDAVSDGKTLGSTDGAGNEVRFSFVTTLAPEWEYMDNKAVVTPGYDANYYRFYMKPGLIWDNVVEMANYGVGLAFHELRATDDLSVDELATRFPLAQQIVLERLSGRGCKMLAEPNGNKAYVTAAKGYSPIGPIVLQAGGRKLVPYTVDGDLMKEPVERAFSMPSQVRQTIASLMQKPAAEREAVNLGVHATDPSWVALLSWLNDEYGKDGEDCLWMPGFEEYFEYNYLRRHAAVGLKSVGDKVTLSVQLPGELYFCYPSLTVNIKGLSMDNCKSVTSNDAVTGLSYAAYDGGVMVNIDCRHALLKHAAHFVDQYRARPTASGKADALYFIGMLKDSPAKEALLGQIK